MIVCGRCGKPLSNPKSIAAGLGRYCKQKLQFDLQIKKIRMRCMYSFYCLPQIEHTVVLLQRAKNKFKQFNLEWNDKAESIILDNLGLLKDKIELTEEEKKELEKHLSEVEDKDIAVAEFFRIIKKCPYGLDCKNPELALEAVYHLIGIVFKEANNSHKIAENFLFITDPLISILELFGTNERQHFESVAKDLKKKVNVIRKKEEEKRIASELEELLELL